MYTIMRYFKQMMALSIPAAIIFICFLPYRRKALNAMGLKSRKRREIGLVVFVMSIFSVLALTLWPQYYWEETSGVWGNLRLLIDRPSYKSAVSLIPFSVFKDYLHDLSQGPAMFFATLLNFFGNLLVFVPIGFFPALLFRKATWKRSATIGLALALFIEVVQYFIMRNTAVDDIILNTIGAVCGYWVYLLCRTFWKQLTESFQCSEHQLFIS